MPARLSHRRPALALATASVALFALTACEKPTPLVTVTSGGSTAEGESTCWAAQGQALPDACQNPPSIGTIKVKPGATVGISVDPKLADAGWRLAIDGQALVSQPIHDDYYAFDVPGQGLGRSDAALQIVVSGQGGSDTSAIRGLWRFTLNQG